MLWVNLASLPSSEGRIYYLAGESQFRNDFDLQFETDDTLKFYTGAGDKLVYRPNHDTLVGHWHFIVATFDTSPAARTLYWDGNLANADQGGGIPNKTSVFSIGESTFFKGRFFRGSIDEVALWNRALTASEVRDIYISTNR